MHEGYPSRGGNISKLDPNGRLVECTVGHPQLKNQQPFEPYFSGAQRHSFNWMGLNSLFLSKLGSAISLTQIRDKGSGAYGPNRYRKYEIRAGGSILTVSADLKQELDHRPVRQPAEQPLHGQCI